MGRRGKVVQLLFILMIREANPGISDMGLLVTAIYRWMHKIHGGFGAFGIGGRSRQVFYARQRHVSRKNTTRGFGIGGRTAYIYDLECLVSMYLYVNWMYMPNSDQLALPVWPPGGMTQNMYYMVYIAWSTDCVWCLSTFMWTPYLFSSCQDLTLKIKYHVAGKYMVLVPGPFHLSVQKFWPWLAKRISSTQVDISSNRVNFDVSSTTHVNMCKCYGIESDR
jgi:hypothetical protein